MTAPTISPLIGSAPIGPWFIPDTTQRQRLGEIVEFNDPYYGGDAEFEEVFHVIAAALPGLHAWVDEQLDGS